MATSATQHIPRSPRNSVVGGFRGTTLASSDRPPESLSKHSVATGICNSSKTSERQLQRDFRELEKASEAPKPAESAATNRVEGRQGRNTDIVSTSASRNPSGGGGSVVAAQSQRRPSAPSVLQGEARGVATGSVATRLRAAVAQAAIDKSHSSACPTPPSSMTANKTTSIRATQTKHAVSSRPLRVDADDDEPPSDCEGGGGGGVEEETMEEETMDDTEEEEDVSGAAAAANDGPSAAADAEVADQRFQAKLVSDEPIRRAPEVQVRPLRAQYVWLSLSPFSHRLPTIVFPPCDSPWDDDPQANVPNAFVTPTSLEPLVAHQGPQRRIGRKGKYEDISFSIPAGSVRFSAVLGTFGAAGFREAVDDDDDDDDDDTENSSRRVFRGENGWSVRWTKRVEPEEYKALHALQKINHFPGTWGIGRKDNLHRHLTKSLVKYGREVYNFHPEAWLLPNDAPALARDMEAAEHAPRGMTKNVYIVKQVASACGRRMRLLCNGKIPKGRWLVQRYVDDPLLIYGYKFDLRLYVVVTSYLPLRVYLYQEGLVRFATTPYPTMSSDDAASGKSKRNMRVKSITAHLTNYSVNKLNGDAFVKPTDDGVDEEKGSKWVLSTVERYFKTRGLPWDATWKRIQDLIVKTLLSVEPDVVQQLRAFIGPRPAGFQNCFELYGFDVLLRENFDPVLMEVNIMPSLSTRCSLLDQRVKANMIADMLTLVGAYSLKKKGHRKPGKDTFAIHPFLSSLSPNELEAVCLAEEEYQRRGHFERLFPTATAHDDYRHLFREVKPLNALLCDWEKHKILVPPVWSSTAGTKTNKAGSAAVPRQESALTSGVVSGASDTDDGDPLTPSQA